MARNVLVNLLTMHNGQAAKKIQSAVICCLLYMLKYSHAQNLVRWSLEKSIEGDAKLTKRAFLQ